ncbi:heparan-alpha-glucosaminide N-acetyltransferase domain-containing protein [Aureispira sp. CCB-E]|uniref:heparan-alpha-glucosaminide N-acetyltransferase domain-containing protein n=1 Tax=Aureispira sp. CCB-E TaxID=3051121 RepID=UPI002868DBE0|nr:heparan-alpha-glucosaminide N-acetyltransferase domain-containing protein [Aureispira sp. CCB-E]WMX13629.1 heparan-alpha-glucosaminide N-acetyltransferase domain-containing protein [Aureispira sp. CCB-E]
MNPNINNRNRVLAIDLARGISVLFVVVVHTLWMYGNPYTQSSTWLGTSIHFIGKGTPMFLIAMGFSFCLSKRQSTRAIIRRALGLLGFGYGMNLFKFVVPYFLGILPTEFIAAYGWTAPLEFGQLTYLLLTGDILQLAGISLLLLVGVQKLGNNKFIPLAIGLLLLIITPFVRGIRLDIIGVDYCLDLLWGGEWNVYFAVFPWFFFILAGMFFGRWFKEKNNHQTFIFRQMLLYGLLFLLIGGGLVYSNFSYHFNDYFHLGPGGAIYLLGFNLVLLFIVNKIAGYFAPNVFFNFLIYSSQRVTLLYVFQWVIICFGMGILGYQQHGVGVVLVLIPIITIFTYFIHFYYEKMHKVSFRKKKKTLGISVR